jgi:hypothetical protein
MTDFAVGNKVLWLDPQAETEHKATIKQLFKDTAKLTLSTLEVVKANLSDVRIAPLEEPRTPPKFPEKIDLSEPSVSCLDLSEIRIDGGTQQRAKCDQSHIFNLVDALVEDVELDPISVFFDGVHYWLVDGFHRYFAYRSEKREVIPVFVSPGTQRDAIIASVGANSDHRALPRNREDKRKAVLALLKDSEWSQWSDREIARRAKVSDKTVAAIRKSLESSMAKLPLTTEETEENSSMRNSALTTERKFVTKHGTVATRKVPQKPPGTDIQIGDRVVSSYSPNLVGEVVDVEDDLARVKWEQTGTDSHAQLSDLKPAVAPLKIAPIEINVKEVILGFLSNLDQMSAEQIQDVFVQSLDRMSAEQTQVIFQACVKRLGKFKEQENVRALNPRKPVKRGN